MPSPAELETAEATQQRAIADIEAIARAAVDRHPSVPAKPILTKASIRSPIDGVVLARSGGAGQGSWQRLRCSDGAVHLGRKSQRKMGCRWTWTKPAIGKSAAPGRSRPRNGCYNRKFPASISPGAVRFGNGGQCGQLQTILQRQ